MSPNTHVPPIAHVATGVTAFDAPDATDVPWLFVAVTVNVSSSTACTRNPDVQGLIVLL